MRNLFKKKAKNSTEKPTSEVDALLNISGPVLHVLIDSKHVATLFREKDEFCLIYRADFLKAGISPFNPTDLKKNAIPEIDKVYRSKVLWQTFASRIPSETRRDYLKIMERLGLKSEKDPLIVLGKIGAVSISKPWKLELVNNKKAC